MASATGTILALDVGAARIGLAIASYEARLASPYGALAHGDDVLARLREVCDKEHVSQLVVGLPRGMSGQATQQTATVQSFGRQLESLDLPVHWQDEAVTSVRAEEELRSRGKPYAKGDIDALAATYILEDYLHENL